MMESSLSTTACTIGTLAQNTTIRQQEDVRLYISLPAQTSHDPHQITVNNLQVMIIGHDTALDFAQWQ